MEKVRGWLMLICCHPRPWHVAHTAVLDSVDLSTTAIRTRGGLLAA
jgi:hypothetical protein